MKRPLKTPADGANEMRKRIKAKIVRMAGGRLQADANPFAKELLAFIGKMDERYQKEIGGLGKK